MIRIIKEMLKLFIDDIDNNRCENLSEDRQKEILNLIRSIANPNEKKTRRLAADFLNISVSSFDNYVRIGLLPKGQKIDADQKTLYWDLYDLQKFEDSEYMRRSD